MFRFLIITGAAVVALATPAAAQGRVSIEQALTQLNGLCEKDYKPACIKFGVAIAGLPARQARKLRSAHPDWWWWEKW
jgi:hypothetical protein